VGQHRESSKGDIGNVWLSNLLGEHFLIGNTGLPVWL